MQATRDVIIKGVREGLLFILDDDLPFDQILSEITERTSANPRFFKGARVTINSGRRIMDSPEFEALYNLLLCNEMQMLALVSLSAQSRMVAEDFEVTSRPPSFASGRPDAANANASNSETGAGLFLRRDLRSGQSVVYGGDVCVLGDVDAGAEIIANGDVVVWGTLRGTVHAGAQGDDEAVICALYLSPTQLGIAGVVSRFPGYEIRYQGNPHSPEVARIEAGRIIVESCQHGGNQGDA